MGCGGDYNLADLYLHLQGVFQGQKHHFDTLHLVYCDDIILDRTAIAQKYQRLESDRQNQSFGERTAFERQ
jgi:hypothetical protein